RLAWVTLYRVSVDHALVTAVQDRLARAWVPSSALVVSASHTHSCPGAFMSSGLMVLVAVDRLDPAVREALVAGVVSAVQRADRARAPALAATTSVTARAVTPTRPGKPR